MAHQHAHTAARKQAIQVLYQMEITGIGDPDIVLAQVNPEQEVLPSKYASLLVRGVVQNQDDIDDKIEEFSESWPLDRMPLVDKAILRLATFEMLFYEACPVSVAINEAVDLAKAFGGEDDSPRFINGVLGRIADRYAELDDSVEEEAEDAAEAESEVSPEAESEASAEANA